MIIESMIIKFIKGGPGVGPEYILTIFGDGRVIYDGKENVKVKGVVSASIDENKILSLLSDFKESDFFSFEDIYPVEDTESRSYTIISISIPQETGEMKTKSVKYHHGDRNVPKELKTLEEKIDETVNSNQWIGELSESEGFETKKEEKNEKISNTEKPKILQKSTKKEYLKLIATAIPILVVIIILVYAFYSGLFDFLSGQKSSEESSIEYGSPEIISFTTASSINGFNSYDQSHYFERNYTVYIYCEYCNISTIYDTKCEMIINITVTNAEYIYFSDSYFISDKNNFHSFNLTCNNSWPLGDYLVTIILLDNISNKSIDSQTNFVLVENYSENPKITVLDSASEIRGINDYDQKLVFNKGETIWVYQEYSNISFFNSTTCDIYINITINVTIDDEWNTYHFDEVNKTEIGNLGQGWWFATDENWPSGLYYVTSYLRDNISGKITSKISTFVII